LNLPELRDAILLDTAVQLLTGDQTTKKNAITMYINVAVNEVATSHSWDFSTDEKATATVANQQEYTLRGKTNNCYNIINVRLGTYNVDEVELTKLSPLTKDTFLSDRTISGTGYWSPNGRHSGFPKIKLYDTPTTVKTMTYRYVRNDVGLGEIPDQFKHVIMSCVIKRMVPGFYKQYEKDINRMISQYDVGGHEPLIAKKDPTDKARNNERARLFGW